MLFKDSLAQGDYIEFRDGMNENATLMRTLTRTGRNVYLPLSSTGRFLWMKFKSDKEFTGTGFQLLYYINNKPKGKISLIYR